MSTLWTPHWKTSGCPIWCSFCHLPKPANNSAPGTVWLFQISLVSVCPSFLLPFLLGLCQAIHSQYVGEISPKKWRGLANATSGFFWSLGKCWGQILGLRYRKSRMRKEGGGCSSTPNLHSPTLQGTPGNRFILASAAGLSWCGSVPPAAPPALLPRVSFLSLNPGGRWGRLPER